MCESVNRCAFCLLLLLVLDCMVSSMGVWFSVAHRIGGMSGSVCLTGCATGCWVGISSLH